MKKIQILGTGCPKCTQLYENAQAAAEQIEAKVEIEKVTNINDIMSFGVMVTPALVIDGRVAASGKVLSAEEIKAMIQ